MQAYQGQTPFIRSNAIFKAAISIHPVEARHAAWIRNLAGQAPAPAAFNPALTKARSSRRSPPPASSSNRPARRRLRAPPRQARGTASSFRYPARSAGG